MGIAFADHSYRAKTRESRHGHRGSKPKKLKLFGFSREVNPIKSSVFLELLDEVPRLTGGRVYPDEIETPRMQLSTVGLFSSAISAKRRKTFEQKNVNQLPEAIRSALNGSGSAEVCMDMKDFEPKVRNVGGKFIVSLFVRPDSADFGILDEANQLVHRKIVEATKTTSRKRRLDPQIDIVKIADKDAAEAAKDIFDNVIDVLNEKTDRFGEIIQPASSLPIVMQPAEEYWVRHR